MRLNLVGGLVAVLIIVALVVAYGTLFTVYQTRQALVVRLGQPVRVVVDPGLNYKIPLIDSVINIDKRILDLENPAQEVIASDQKRLVVDVRSRRADLPEQNSQAVYQRMQTERQQEAAQYRAEGAQKAQEIRAKADRDVTVLLAEAQSKGERTRGEGDAERNRIFADAYGRDPDFFSFYRSMQAYIEGLKANDTRMLLKPDSEFFRYFVDPSGKSREGGAQPGNTPPAK